jgi:hypothetical protein
MGDGDNPGGTVETGGGGEGQVGIAAEAGAGKSRLAYEFRRRLWDRPVLFLAGRCISYASGVPYLLILKTEGHANIRRWTPRRLREFLMPIEPGF